MNLNKIVEVIFTLLMLLFLAVIVLGILVVISLVQQLEIFRMDFKIQLLFIGGMFAVFLYITKMIVERIREYNRYI